MSILLGNFNKIKPSYYSKIFAISMNKSSNILDLTKSLSSVTFDGNTTSTISCGTPLLDISFSFRQHCEISLSHFNIIVLLQLKQILNLLLSHLRNQALIATFFTHYRLYNLFLFLLKIVYLLFNSTLSN